MRRVTAFTIEEEQALDEEADEAAVRFIKACILTEATSRMPERTIMLEESSFRRRDQLNREVNLEVHGFLAVPEHRIVDERPDVVVQRGVLRQLRRRV